MRPSVIASLERAGLGFLAPFVPTLGAMFVVIILLGGMLLWRRAREAGLSGAQAINIWIVGAASGAVGARVFYLLVNGFPDSPREWIRGTGTASWGVYVGAALGIASYAVMRRLRPWPWIDIVVSIQPIGEVIGRIGCWLAGDDFGRVAQIPWAIRFPPGSLPFNAQLARGELTPGATTSLPVHPQQLYLAVNALILAWVMARVWRRHRDRPGFTTMIFLLAYGSTRFAWEFFRDPAGGGAVRGLSTSQWMCVAYLFGGVILWLTLRRRYSARLA